MGLKQVCCVDMNPQAVPEMYLCPTMDEQTLMADAVGYVRVGAEPSQGQIADGAQLTVAPGQCMLITRGEQIAELCAEPGVYIYNRETPGSFLMGKLSRIAATQNAQSPEGPEKVIYLNVGEIGGNAFQCPQKVTFQTEDGSPSAMSCRGRYCYSIANPILFYRYASAGIDRASLDGFLMEQFLSIVQPTYDRLAAMGVTDATLSAHTSDLMATMRALLYDKWYITCGMELRRASVTTVSFTSGSYNPFQGVTVQADKDELPEDDQLEKAAKDFLSGMLSAFGTAFNSTGE